MELIGTVLDVKENRAIVRFKKGCDKNCGACFVGRLFVIKDADICEVEAMNPVGACPGDAVRLEIGTKIALSAYLLAYGLPFAGFLLGAIAGNLLSHLFHMKDNPLFISLFAFLGLGICFAITVKKGKNFKALPIVMEIINSGNPANKEPPNR
ncbi:SoxR reducing system RseC family protein [Candidatus Sumerlaeota bacterium]|nr:SoxR reducing system RseC family protein [Candidatus Sumerlaeota bacterium]